MITFQIILKLKILSAHFCRSFTQSTSRLGREGSLPPSKSPENENERQLILSHQRYCRRGAAVSVKYPCRGQALTIVTPPFPAYLSDTAKHLSSQNTPFSPVSLGHQTSRSLLSFPWGNFLLRSGTYFRNLSGSVL